MSSSAPNPPPLAFRLKGTMPALSLIQLQSEDMEAVEAQLAEHLRQMPMFFLHAPVLVDLSEMGGRTVDLSRLDALLRKHRLVPVAVRNPTDAQQVQAVGVGWGVLQTGLAATRHTPPDVRPAGASFNRRRPSRGSAPPPESLPEAAPEAAPAAAIAPETAAAGLTVRTPVRSGQVIHAVGGDLVVLAPVSSGAELIADGNIHVYAPLRGRALAGACGDPNVSIFCLGMQAEFLSIAGRYLMAEQIGKKYRDQPTRAHLKDEALTLSSL